MHDMNNIEATIRNRLAEDFATVRILRIDISEDVDFDGDDILKVKVVFEGPPSDLDRRALVSSVRRVRDALATIGVFEFPAVSFISAEDAAIKACA